MFLKLLFPQLSFPEVVVTSEDGALLKKNVNFDWAIVIQFYQTLNVTTTCGGLFTIGDDFHHLRIEQVPNELVSSQLM